MTVYHEQVRFHKQVVGLIDLSNTRIVFEYDSDSKILYLLTSPKGFEIKIERNLGGFVINSRPLCRLLMSCVGENKTTVFEIDQKPVSEGCFKLSKKS